MKSDDEFLSWMKDAAGQVFVYRKYIAIGLAACGLVVLATVGFRLFMKSGQSKAVTAMSEAEEVFYAPVAAPNNEGSALPDDLQFDTEQERFEAALEKFNDISKKYGRSEQGQLAHFYSALSLQHMLKNEEAAAAYKKFLTRAKPENPLWSIAWQGVGYCEEALENYDSALDAFGKMAENENDPYFKTQSFLHMARVYEIQKNFSAALEKLAAYSGEAGESDPNKRQIERRIAILKRLKEINEG
jgi:tetratricopeptide (TPR) repeat protein